jgi:starch phosphorylase
MLQVGRVPLILLDSNVPQNSPNDRQLTLRLYSSDLEIRISQEILLGIGGVRALRKLGYQPDLWHMNEGHPAFLTLENVHELIESGMSFEEASEKYARPTFSLPIHLYRPETISFPFG